ncbi:MAG: Bro-N domain-containing protein [Thermoplasmata archaeon]|nr:Bro-N domain-containing protein [Thermoplasmata archaeon]MCK5398080.1 Bro-N domain-containing protein [Thermoplasmata archaeon]
MTEEEALVVFQGKGIRRIWHEREWHFSIVDIVAALTESPTPRQYWGKVKDREFTGLELSPIWVQLKLEAQDGRMRLTDCANTKSLFRIIQSIPSKKAEPFKQWLAQVGYERVEEIQNPELAQKRMKELYRAKGYSDDWIEKRVRGIAIRDELTEEWQNRDVNNPKEYAILTAEISKATFGLTPSEYRRLKGLKKENLRDHMDDLELIFSMLGERVTTEITRNKNSQGYDECEDAAQEGGQVAGNARKDAESKIGRSIVSEDNFLQEPEKKTKKLSKKKK